MLLGQYLICFGWVKTRLAPVAMEGEYLAGSHLAAKGWAQAGQALWEPCSRSYRLRVV